ncbi:unnamed protein product [Caenorhabditis auriculariae]|uniref:Potassium channel tetramerisation-type BTB domain-containing protein n=1 Tax=Caenorhabditis auriculariae TaxID=2777116 RepID=A0A8S1GUD3_9PELO|nr:unnamed protein product [Caenorhabditis auriculariae]
MHRNHVMIKRTVGVPTTSEATTITITSTSAPTTYPPSGSGIDETSDVFFLVSVVAPLLFCCFAIFMADNLLVRFNVGGKKFATLKTNFPADSIFYKFFMSRTAVDAPFFIDKDGSYFVDRDPDSFNVILNYFRLKKSKQIWESCLPKDPDRLALLTQEADFFCLPELTNQAIYLLQACSQKSATESTYVSKVFEKSPSMPTGFLTSSD